MGDDGPTASIILFIILLLVNVFLYGFSAALSALNGKEREESEDKKTKRLNRMVENPARYDNMVYLVSTLIFIGIGAFILPLFA